jgi:hypothetical protein
MNKLAMTQAIMVAKETKELTWEKIGEVIGMSPEWTASACLGMNSMPADTAKKNCVSHWIWALKWNWLCRNTQTNNGTKRFLPIHYSIVFMK